VEAVEQARKIGAIPETLERKAAPEMKCEAKNIARFLKERPAPEPERGLSAI
jgi:hypothetical protein